MLVIIFFLFSFMTNATHMSDAIEKIEYRSGLASFSGETEIIVLNNGQVSTSLKRGKVFKQFQGKLSPDERSRLFLLAAQVLGVKLAATKNLPPDASPTFLKIEMSGKAHEWAFAANEKFKEKNLAALVRQLEKTSELVSHGEIKY